MEALAHITASSSFVLARLFSRLSGQQASINSASSRAFARQLRDEGVIVEARPGLYELQPTVARYITYIGGAGKETLTNERMMLTRAKREAAEMENDLRRGEVHRTADIERGIQSMFLNIRSRFLALPAKLSPTLSTMGGDQTGIFDELKGAIEEILEEMSDYRVAFATEDGEDDGEAEKETPM